MDEFGLSNMHFDLCKQNDVCSLVPVQFAESDGINNCAGGTERKVCATCMS